MRTTQTGVRHERVSHKKFTGLSLYASTGSAWVNERMSIQAVSWVLDHSQAQHGERLVLIAIANHYDFNDPALVVIARESRLSRSAVIRAVAKLEKDGELEVDRDASGGRSRKNHYRIPGYEQSRNATHAKETVAFEGETVANPTENGSADATRTVSNRVQPGEGAPDGASRRGSRIPETFEVTPEMVVWSGHNCPDVDWPLATKTFVAHWKAESGARATKLDWTAAWRKWLLKDQASARRGAVRTHL